MTFKAACPYCGNLVAVSPDQKTGVLRSGVICDIDHGGCDSWFFVFGEVKLVYESRKIEGEGKHE